MSDTPIPVWMKLEVLERDGWNCLRCQRPVHIYPGGKSRPDSLQFDHIIPECRRGMTTTDNLQVLCRSCNQWKGIQVIDFRPRPRRDARNQAALAAAIERRNAEWQAQAV